MPVLRNSCPASITGHPTVEDAGTQANTTADVNVLKGRSACFSILNEPRLRIAALRKSLANLTVGGGSIRRIASLNKPSVWPSE
jgi:hypothetical protein